MHNAGTQDSGLFFCVNCKDGKIGGCRLSYESRKSVGPPEMPKVARSFHKIAFFGPDAVVLRSLYEEFNFAPLSVIRALGWPVADHV
jgi:hypothetical protein